MTAPINLGGTQELSDEKTKARIVADLDRARARTQLLTEALDDAELVAQHSRLMSPLVWDLDPILPETVDQLYDAFTHPRADRPALPLLDPATSRRYVGEVRTKVIDLLERTPLHGRRLTEGGFVFGMIAQRGRIDRAEMEKTFNMGIGMIAVVAPEGRSEVGS